MSKKLIGSDGALYAGKYGEEVIEAAVLAWGVFYEITAIGASTVFPAGAAVGYLVQGDGVLTLATGDTALPLDTTPLCDMTTYSLEFTKSEAEVTTFCSENKEFRASKYDDVGGTMEGIMTEDITDQPDQVMNHFVTIVDDTTGTYTISPQTGDVLLAQFFTDENTTVDEVQSFYFLPVVLTGFNASAGGDEAQTFSSPFRAAPSTNGVVYYRFPVLAAV